MQKFEAETQKLLSQCHYKQVKAGTVLLRPGDNCQFYALVQAGSIKLSITSETGREIVLYRVRSNDACILSTACLFNQEPFPALAVAEMDSQILMVPLPLFEQLLDQSPRFRQQVFQQFTQRLSQVMQVIDQLVFSGIEQRLATFLLTETEASPARPLVLTHEAIASEIGSVREVISRVLRRWQQAGIVELARGQITITERVSLEQIRAGH